MKKMPAGMLISILAGLCVCSYALADMGQVTAVRFQDPAVLIIETRGEIGAHSAFIMDNPHRIVTDIRDAQAVDVEGRVPIDRNGVREIRTGSHHNKVRVVIDFGPNPAPPFSIERSGSLIMVKLDSAREARTPAPVRAKPVAAKAESGRGWAGEARGPATLEIQDAGVSDSGVFVELADPQNPSRSYRMTVELDQRHMEIKSALLQAGAGPPKRFRLTNASAAGRPAKPEAETLRRPMQERRSVKPKWETRAPQGEFAYKRRTRTMPLSESELTE